jgi:hypothetical protein
MAAVCSLLEMFITLSFHSGLQQPKAKRKKIKLDF